MANGNPHQLTPAEREALRTRVETLGLAKVSQESGASPHALSRAMAELPTRLGTAALVRAWLAGPVAHVVPGLRATKDDVRRGPLP